MNTTPTLRSAARRFTRWAIPATVLAGTLAFVGFKLWWGLTGVVLANEAVAHASAENPDALRASGVEAAADGLGILRPALEPLVRAEAARMAANPRPPAEMIHVPDRFVELLLPDKDTPTEALLIRTAELDVEVKAYDPFHQALSERLAAAGGKESGATVRRDRDRFGSATLELRVPNAGLDALVAWIEETAHVSRITIESEEVTDQWIDHSARLRNAQRTQAELETLLTRPNGELKDVLAVEAELARVRLEMEQTQGKLRYLADKISMSTLTLRVHEARTYTPTVKDPVPTQPYLSALKDSAVGSFQTMGQVGRAGSLALVALGPWMVLFGGVLGVARRGWRWWMRRR